VRAPWYRAVPSSVIGYFARFFIGLAVTGVV